MMAYSDTAYVTFRPAVGEDRPDVFQRIEADHQRLRDLLDQLRHGRGRHSDPAHLFDQLCDAVEAYGAAAEQSLYAELLARAGQEDQWPARQAVAVHDMAELMLFELSFMEIDSADWHAGLDQLAGYLEDHFRLESGEVFLLAKSLLDRDEAVRLGSTYAQARLKWIDCFGRAAAASEPAFVTRPGFPDNGDRRSGGFHH
ncbi:MAG: hypothetical protein Tsb0032_09010 [Kiloniellaceae bacterium]